MRYYLLYIFILSMVPFLRYLLLFWPVRQSRAVVEPNLSLSQNTPISWYTYCYTHMCNDMYISWCVNQVMVFTLLVYSVNNMRRPLLYVIYLWTYLLIRLKVFFNNMSNWLSLFYILLSGQTESVLIRNTYIHF